MKAEENPELPPLVQQVIRARTDSDKDPLGSYTGVAQNPQETPVQDADDL